MRYLGWTLLLLCAACVQLGDAPSPQHYYLLETLERPVALPVSTPDNIIVEIADFPDYLDRPQIAVRSADRQISYLNGQRWAEPLRDNLSRILRENLSLLLPGMRISVAPWDSPTRADRRIQLFINDFTGVLEGRADVDIRWQILREDLVQQRGHFTAAPSIGAEYADLVRALNQALDDLSRQLAEQLVE